MTSPVLWYATRATGLVALVLLTGTVVLGTLTGTRFSTRSWPGFAQQALHRSVSLLSVVFVACHILTSVLDAYVHIGWAGIVVPFASGYKPLWVGIGAVAFDALAAVTISSLLRHRIPARAWRAVHWLGYLCWPVAMAHAFGIGTDMAEPWAVGLGASCAAAVAAGATARAVAAARTRRRAVTAAPVLADAGPKHLSPR